MDEMKKSPDPRVIMVGSVTGNDNTVGGGGVYPIADLKDLDGFKAGFENPIAMADGYGFDGAKAYKDSKLCLMMMSNVLHAKYNKINGISFSSLYPGCIAESPLFREKRAWFRKYFPLFMKYITGGFVSEQEAGQRLFQVIHDPRCKKSGGKVLLLNLNVHYHMHILIFSLYAVYWSWNGGPREGRGMVALEQDGQISGGGGAGGGWDSIYENDQSGKVNNIELGIDLFRYSTKITGAEWPDTSTPRSPCPTLNVVGAISKAMIEKEELKRMVDRPGLNEDGTPITVPKSKKVKAVAQKVVGGVAKGTIGRVAGFLGRRILGRVPDAALEGSFQEEKPQDANPLLKTTSITEVEVIQKDVSPSDQELLEKEIAQQIFSEENKEVNGFKTDDELIEELMTDKSSRAKASSVS